MIEFVYKHPGHAEYRLQVEEYKKMSRYFNDITRKKQPLVNWSASSGVIFTSSGMPDNPSGNKYKAT